MVSIGDVPVVAIMTPGVARWVLRSMVPYSASFDSQLSDRSITAGCTSYFIDEQEIDRCLFWNVICRQEMALLTGIIVDLWCLLSNFIDQLLAFRLPVTAFLAYHLGEIFPYFALCCFAPIMRGAHLTVLHIQLSLYWGYLYLVYLVYCFSSFAFLFAARPPLCI